MLFVSCIDLDQLNIVGKLVLVSFMSYVPKTCTDLLLQFCTSTGSFKC